MGQCCYLLLHCTFLVLYYHYYYPPLLLPCHCIYIYASNNKYMYYKKEKKFHRLRLCLSRAAATEVTRLLTGYYYSWLKIACCVFLISGTK